MNENPSYYAIIPANVRYDKALTPNAKLLYGEVTALANSKGYCYASNKYFSELYKCSPDTISRLINQLVKKKYLKLSLVYREGTKEIQERRLYIVDPIGIFTDTPIGKNTDTPIGKNAEDNTTRLNKEEEGFALQNVLDRKREEIKEYLSSAPARLQTSSRLTELNLYTYDELFDEYWLTSGSLQRGKQNAWYLRGFQMFLDIKITKDLEALRKQQEKAKKKTKTAPKTVITPDKEPAFQSKEWFKKYYNLDITEENTRTI